MPATYVLKKADGTTLLSLSADSSLRSPTEKNVRGGQIFQTPNGPFVQYAGETLISPEFIRVRWRLSSSAQVQTLREAARGDFGDEFLLGNPYEADIKVALVPGPEGLRLIRYPGVAPNEFSDAETVFVRVG